MLCQITNGCSAYLSLDGAVCVNTPSPGEINKRLNNDAQLRGQSYTKFRVNPEALIGLEMSFVPQVESVFVEPAPRKAGFHVFTIVNDRDPKVRAQIYQREQAIMD